MVGEFFDHGFFPLEEGLQLKSCVSCHTTSDYSSTPTDCMSCHETDYNSAENPSHTVFNLSTDCTECHTLSPDWQPAVFSDHDNYFPIYSGGHAGTWDACVDCHTTEGSFQAFECINCHIQGETAEQHEAVVGYYYNDTYCKACHPTGEADQLFDHSSTAFPLEGVHLQTDCRSCHEVGFAGTSTVCVDCHQMDYTSSVDPNHINLNLSLDCVSCHTAEPDWQPALFPVHDEFYELRGAHQAIENECFRCHMDGYQNTPNTCVGCHQGLYETTENPNHTAAQFIIDCASCHNEETWNETNYGHEFYPLTGAHAEVAGDCISCHTNEVYQGTPNTCVDCHQLDYDGAKSPDHVQFSFPNDCASCHSNDYQTAEPNHEQLGYSTNCVECHAFESFTWSASGIDHSFFPLENAHSNLECTACHLPNTFSGLSPECFSCHEPDYQAALQPNHVQSAFPKDCTLCHTLDRNWMPAEFSSHDAEYFPIYSGNHQGEWNSCIDCHTVEGNYSIFSCIDCHEHNDKNRMDREHRGINGYVFESNACYSCHPTGEED